MLNKGDPKGFPFFVALAASSASLKPKKSYLRRVNYFVTISRL